MGRLRKKSTDTPLRNVRRARTLTQAQMAMFLNISQQNYAKYEIGLIRPTVDIQARIAAVLGVSQRDVFPPEDEAEVA